MKPGILKITWLFYSKLKGAYYVKNFV